jgi:hypothetical protein
MCIFKGERFAVLKRTIITSIYEGNEYFNDKLAGCKNSGLNAAIYNR